MSGVRVFAMLLMLAASQPSAAEVGVSSRASKDEAPGVGSADGVLIRYQSFGRGEPALVLVHCWSCDRHLWDDVVPRLARDRQVVTLDLAGHGESGRERKEWTIEAFGEDVRAVVEALGLRKVILAGHSMGGPVILEAARRVPGRVVGLIPIDTALNVEQTNSFEEVAGYLEPFEKDYPAAAQRFTRQYMFAAKSDPLLIDRVATANAVALPEVAIPCLRAAFSYDARPALSEVRVPAHAINADRFPTDVAANRRHFASYELTLMTGVGHYLMLEDSKRFSELLAKAVAQLLAAKPAR